MQHKLKYIELFESTLNLKDIPYLESNGIGTYDIKIEDYKLDSLDSIYDSIEGSNILRSLRIKNSDTLKAIDTFNNITEIPGGLVFDDITNLEYINGFRNLKGVHNELYLSSLPNIKSFEGINNLEWVNRYIGLENLPKLPEFPNLKIIRGSIWIENNYGFNNIQGFNKIKTVIADIKIRGNSDLIYIDGFLNLEEIGGHLELSDNSKFINISLPSRLIRVFTKREKNMILIKKPNILPYHKIYRPEYLINNIPMIKDFIEKFDPAIHDGKVVKLIIENLELWGTEETKRKVLNHMLSKGNYINYIPNAMLYLVEDHYKHLYHSDFNNTGAKSVAKVATGVTYGLF